MSVTVTNLPPVAPVVAPDNKIDNTEALTHVSTAAGTLAQSPETPVVNVLAASTVGTPPQLSGTVTDFSPVVNVSEASTVGTPAQLLGTVTDLLPIVNVPEASTVGITGIANAQTQITTGQLPSTVLADSQVHLQPLHLQPLQTPLQGVDGILAGAPQFPLYYKPTGEDWNGISGGNEYPFGVQEFNDGLLGHLGSGYNMLTGPVQEAWLSAQNLSGTAGLETNNWNFGTDPSTVETNMPRPTYHPLPMQESNVEQLEQLGTRVRKPAGRKEVVPLTEITKSEDDKIPEWMTLAIEYLKEGLGSKEWLDCVDAWVAFEKKIGVQSSTSVSTNCDEFFDRPTHKFLASLAREESP